MRLGPSLFLVVVASSCVKDNGMGNGPFSSLDTDTTTTTTTTVPYTTPVPADPVWMAVSGGGYHSHTAQAAWMMSMMEASGLDLEALTVNVPSIASNSGGSWFVSQLAYSERFRSALENEPDLWQTTGYLGQTVDLFQVGDPCEGWTGSAGVICNNFDELEPIFAALKLPGGNDLSWYPFVNDIVFGPYEMANELSNTTLDDTKQDWAADKTLIFATSMLTEETLLEEEPGIYRTKDVYSAIAVEPGVPRQQNFTPAFFSTTAANVIPPDFLSVGSMRIDYMTNDLLFADTASVGLPGNQNVNVPVIIAATTSSAAAAAGVSIRCLDQSHATDIIPLTNDTIAYVLRDVAPAFQINQGVAPLNPVPPYVDEQADLSAFRLGDGAYNDNTAVAYLLRHLADNGNLDDFQIVSFMNTTSELLPQGVPSDVALLFGDGVRANGSIDLCALGFCIKTMSPHVFEAVAFENVTPNWTYSDRGVTLNHVEFEVVTVDNATFGIEGGHSGILHVFVSQNEASDNLPMNAGIFQAYSDVIDVTREAVVNQGGWEELAAVLQVP